MPEELDDVPEVEFLSLYEKSATHYDALNPPLGSLAIVDTTCRDGEQMPGVAFTGDEKLEIARMLDKLGVEQIETFATYNDSDRKSAKAMLELGLKASIMGWNRCVVSEIEDSLRSGIEAVAISYATSDIHLKYKLKLGREEQLKRISEAVKYAKAQGAYVCFNAEDATRTQMDYLLEYVRAGRDAGADRFRLCDTIGVLTPTTAHYMVQKILEEVPIDIELHFHNDFGIGLANVFAACEAAAKFPRYTMWISTSILNFGERAGNVPLEATVINLKKHYGKTHYRSELLYPLAAYVSKITKIPIPLNYPVVGGNVFRHKSGMHVDGILKNPLTYEPFRPEEVGMRRIISVGKHSGKAAIRYKLDELGLEATDEQVEELRVLVNAVGEDRKSVLTDDEFINLLTRIQFKKPRAQGKRARVPNGRKAAAKEKEPSAGAAA